MLRIICFALLLVLAGCGGLSPMVISSEQLQQVPEGGGLCSTIMGPWGNARFVYVHAAKGTLPNGTISIDPNTCAITMNNEPVPKAIPVVVVPPPAVAPVPVMPWTASGFLKTQHLVATVAHVKRVTA